MLQPTTHDRNFYQQLKIILETEAVVVATIVKVMGSAPREVGAKMAVLADGSIIGTIGGGAGEGKVIKQALAVLKTGNKQLVEVDLTGTPGEDVQGVCGGKVQVWLEKWSGENAVTLVEQILKLFESGQSGKLITPFTQTRPYLIVENSSFKNGRLAKRPYAFIETIQPPPMLLIIGGGHIALALAQIASFAGFEIVVQDDRPEFITPQRFPQAAFLTQSIDEALDRFIIHQQLYIALVTRGLPQDIAALKAILQRPLIYQYIGAIGSQKRIRQIDRAIPNSLKKLPNFYAPIGLDIGALNPEEIAVSICGELIKVRRGGTGLSLCDRLEHSRSKKVHIGELLYAKLQ